MLHLIVINNGADVTCDDLSCTSSVLSGDNVYCRLYGACESATSITATTGVVACQAEASCQGTASTYVPITGATYVECGGKQSCQYATITTSLSTGTRLYGVRFECTHYINLRCLCCCQTTFFLHTNFCVF